MADKLTLRNKRSARSKGNENKSSKHSSGDRKVKSPSERNSPPPVMARSYSMDMPLQNTKVAKKYTRRVRRRLDISLPVPGAEIRLPSIPIISVSSRVLAIILFGILIISAYLLWKSPIFRVDQLTIEGVTTERAQALNTILNISDTPIFLIKSHKLIQEIQQAFPEVSAVTVQMSLPNHVIVQVTERIPVLGWRQNNVTKLVDSQGFAFPFRLVSGEPISPIVDSSIAPPGIASKPQSAEEIIEKLLKAATGDEEPVSDIDINKIIAEPDQAYDSPVMTSDMVMAVLTIAKSIPEGTQISYTAEHGFGWQDPRGWSVYIGDASDIDMKLVVYDAIVNYVTGNGQQASVISVEHVHSPYYRLEQ